LIFFRHHIAGYHHADSMAPVIERSKALNLDYWGAETVGSILLKSWMLGRAMAQVVSRRPLTAEARVRARIDVGFVVDKVALGQVFS
jgi:hypothetical protein